MTWNIEGLKTNEYVFSDLLLDNLPDLVFISEPQVYQTDVHFYLKHIKHEYLFYLNSDDRHDPELPLLKSCSHGGTLLFWLNELDPYVRIYPVTSTAFTPLILTLPNTALSIHIVFFSSVIFYSSI